jgi:glycine/D-amino acid oxidase-like deaminating enzyme
MTPSNSSGGQSSFDAVVLGGGFFGCSIAGYLKPRMPKVLVVEQEDQLFRHASYVNQARIHNGYHYPRSLHTAYRSHVNFQSFIRDYPECVVSNFTKLYAIARHHSKVNARQFERFCNIIGAPWKPARAGHVKLFNPRLIEAVYEVQEYAFDSNILRDTVRRKLDAADVDVRLNSRVERVEAHGSMWRVFLSGGVEVETRYLFNCTYAGLKHIPGLESQCQTILKHEITEMALIEPPEQLRHLGVTVMCGPFFSTMPFPPRGLHTLSHVRYTPHASWIDSGPDSPDPYAQMKAYSKQSKACHMLKDAQRYLPALSEARIVDSLFEVKTLLVRNEIDDGRPILMERGDTPSTIYSILGGKIDNIYDVIHRLKAEGL